MKIKYLGLICWMAVSGFSLAYSQEKHPLPTKKVAVFKDGSAFVVREGTVKLKEKTFSSNELLPKAMFGTFWLYAPGNPIVKAVTILDKVEKEKELKTTYDIFKENIGKQLTLILNSPIEGEGKVEYTGKIASVIGQQVSIKTNNGWLTVPITQVSRFIFLEKPVYEGKEEKQEKVLQVEFKDKQPSQKLELMYLTKNMGWVPNYLVELWGKDKATITLRGMLFNDEEEIENAEVNFVVGIPNFKYGTRISPLISKEKFNTFMQQLQGAMGYLGVPATSAPVQAFSNSYTYAQTGGDMNGQAPGIATEDIVAAEGEEGEDLYFYSLKGISLQKNAHGIFDIFRSEVTCKHIYDAKIDANQPSYRYYTRYNQSDEFIREVWHSIELENTTDFPWTTGTVFISKSEEGDIQPVSENRIDYTPKKGDATIRLTMAPDVLVKDTETEIERNENKKTINKIKYDLLTIQGNITVKNYKSKDIELNIKRQITGLLKKSSPEWLISDKFRNSGRDLNEKHDVCWEIKLKAGEEKEIKYTYEVYVPK